MKNSLKLTVLLSLIFAFTSCKKEYTCTCTANGSSTTQTIEATSRAQASDICDAFEFDFLGTSSECSVN